MNSSLLLRILFPLLPFSVYVPKDYITIHLDGQFGNQLFEIATAYAYSLDHEISLTIPDLASRTDLGIPYNTERVFRGRISSYKPIASASVVWKEPNFNHFPLPPTPRLELRGFFQSYKYFQHRRKEILELFAAPAGLNEQILARYPMLASDQLVVGVQIRDYREDHPSGGYHPTMDRSYYEKAVAQFPEDAFFFVSSNNRRFAAECMQGLAKNIVYLDGDYIDEFYTLVLCKSFIISNSTFGWWAAWLSPAENKRVIVPSLWFTAPYENETMKQDLLPNDYEVLEQIAESDRLGSFDFGRSGGELAIQKTPKKSELHSSH